MAPRSSSRMPCLPAGFRFHPTDEELIVHYLMNQAASIPCPVPIIAEVNIYQCNPWDLPPKALFGENEWYFFSPRDRKYPNGARPNRAAGSGYWKATGTDKAILSTPTSENIGVKKALVFYRGKPPKGVKTDWIMHEYRLTAGNRNTNKRRGSSSSMRLDDWVLCRIYKKNNNFQFSDQEQDVSTVEEDSSLNTTAMNNASPKSSEELQAAHHAGDYEDHQLQQHPHLNMTKSCSLTDLLNTIDYSALSQLLLDGPDQPQQQSPLIYTTTPDQFHHQPLNVNNNNNATINVDDDDDALVGSGYYGAGCNSSTLLKRKRVTTTTDQGAGSSFDDGGRFAKRPSDSRSSALFGSSGSSSYCNQQLAEPGSGSSLQNSSSLLMSYPFFNQQQLLLNNHLEMQ